MWPRILAAFLSFALLTAQATQPFLVPGALPPDCRSALIIGVVACFGQTPASGVSEAQVSRYLAQFGKPPREAVRVLLDPSDANIAAWIRKQRQIVSTASYVAARMTEMQSRLEGKFQPDQLLAPVHTPAMMQVRATLFMNSYDAPPVGGARALEQLVGRYPSIDGRLVQIGQPPSGRLSAWLAKLDTVLPVTILPNASADDLPVPSLLIEDLRHGTRRHLEVTAITPQYIRDQIVALRTAAEAGGRQIERATPQ